MKRNLTLLICFLSLLTVQFSCSTDDDNPTPVTNHNPGNNNSGTNQPSNEVTWLIPTNEIYDGGVGKDGIPSIDDPNFVPASTAHFVEDDDLVVGIKFGNQIKAYPHFILDWHEIVNDELMDLKLALTYCPLTGTAIGWNRTIEGEETTFGVSGFLHNSNLMPYDRETNSLWSQMRLDCINGERIRTVIETVQIVETTWETWRTMFPDSEVLSTDTGYGRDYSSYPYGNYKESSAIFFPVNSESSRLHNKMRALGVLVENAIKIYPIDRFATDEPRVINDQLHGKNIVVIGHEKDNFMVAFDKVLDGKLLEFSPIDGLKDGGLIMEDDEGNQWNIFGEAVAGPREGQMLNQVTHYIGFWFAWEAFFPDSPVFGY